MVHTSGKVRLITGWDSRMSRWRSKREDELNDREFKDMGGRNVSKDMGRKDVSKDVCRMVKMQMRQNMGKSVGETEH